MRWMLVAILGVLVTPTVSAPSFENTQISPEKKMMSEMGYLDCSCGSLLVCCDPCNNPCECHANLDRCNCFCAP